jgi:hypothetical protein
MSFQGRPDLQQPLRAEDCEIYFPYAGTGSHVLAPHHLEIADTPLGRPDFLLELVRGTNPMLPPKPYGVLDFRLRPQFRMDDALSVLRARVPNATLGYPSFTNGFLALEATTQSDFPSDLLRPIPLSWNGLATARFVLKISTDSAAVIKQALAGDALALLAVAVLEMEGVSPRVPLKVRFQSAELLTKLTALGAGGIVAWADIANHFSSNWKDLPITVDGTWDDRLGDDFGEAMTDRLRLNFGTLVPSPEGQHRAYMTLKSPEQGMSGSMEWDLSEPILAPRPLVLELNPLEAAKKLVAAEGLAAVARETVVPPMQTGAHRISIAANLPGERPDVVACGVTLRVPPRPPFRPQALVETSDLIPPADRATILLRLSPKEDLEYTYSTYLAVGSGGSVERLDGTETPSREENLDITIHDFPVDFVPVEASNALLEVATIYGTCRGTAAAGPVERRFELTAGRAAIVLPFPKGTTGIVCDAVAQSTALSTSLALSFPLVSGLALDLTSFPEYGAHAVEVECEFGDADRKLAAIDLLPEGSPETAGEIDVLSFTPAIPKKEWRYVARSPFQAGYRYREHRGPDEPPAPWSDVQSPFLSLRIAATAFQVTI